MTPDRRERYADGWERLGAMPVPDGGMTLDEVASVVGCSRANIWFIERRAIAKLKRWAEGWREEAP